MLGTDFHSLLLNEGNSILKTAETLSALDSSMVNIATMEIMEMKRMLLNIMRLLEKARQ